MPIQLLKLICQMKKTFLIILFVFFLVVYSSYAYKFAFIINPVTNQPDYYATSNMSGSNMTADYYFGLIGCNNIYQNGGGSDVNFCDDAVGGGSGGGDKWVDLGAFIAPNATYASKINITGGDFSYIDYLFITNGLIWSGLSAYNQSGDITTLNNSINAINSSLSLNKLNTTDQRFNETSQINDVNSSLNSLKLNASDQRYNESGAISSVNSSLWANKLNTTDQSYNETGTILSVNSSLDNTKLDKTDQRYNETATILNVNNTRAGLGSYQCTDTSQRLYNLTLLTTGVTALCGVDLTGGSVNLSNDGWIINNQSLAWNDTKGYGTFVNFTGYNKSSWDTAYSWGNHSQAGYLLSTDQRFNDTNAINTINATELADNLTQAGLIYGLLSSNTSTNSRINTINATEIADNLTQAGLISGLLSSNTSTNSRIDDVNSSLQLNKLNVSDQRYNDSGTISAVNTSLWNNKLNITDQQYNETNLINTVRVTRLNLTSATYNGSLNYSTRFGYDAGSAICNATFNGYRMCTEFDVSYFIQTQNFSTIGNDDAWTIAGGSKYATGEISVNDCKGWTWGIGGTYAGNYWKFNTTTGGYGTVSNCATAIKIACCG